MVEFQGQGCAKLGLVAKRVDVIDDALAERISTLLTEVSSHLMESKAGHVPDQVVRQIIHPIYTSPKAVSETFRDAGHRFIVCTPTGALVATALVSREPDVILGYSGLEPVRAVSPAQSIVGPLHPIRPVVPPPCRRWERPFPLLPRRTRRLKLPLRPRPARRSRLCRRL